MSGMVPPCMRQVWSRNVITCTHDVGRGVWVALAHMPGVDETKCVPRAYFARREAVDTAHP